MPVDTNIALTTYATVKSELDLSDDTKQTYLERQINVISQKIADYCNRKFKKQTYTLEKYQGTDTLELNLKNYPVTDPITALVIDDATVDLDYVTVDSDEGILYYESIFTKNGWVTSITETLTLPERNISVTYEAGYDLPDQVTPTLPYDLEEACINEVVEAYNKKGKAKSQNLESWTLDKATKKFSSVEKVIDTETGFLLSTKSLLDSKYKRWII